MRDVFTQPSITVIIPVLNERDALPQVLAALPWNILSEVIVVDNGSTDGTGEIARQSGARVVYQPQQGYGAACLAGIQSIQQADIVVFLDGDYSDFPQELSQVVAPILKGRADMVIGSRVQGTSEPGALPPQVRWGNWLAVTLIRMLYGIQYSDLGPFRAIRHSALQSLNMCDQGYGWTVEMQVRAAKIGLQIEEVPVRYRKRVGHSKISGTVRGCVLAGAKIISTILRYAVQPVECARPGMVTKPFPASPRPASPRKEPTICLPKPLSDARSSFTRS